MLRRQSSCILRQSEWQSRRSHHIERNRLFPVRRLVAWYQRLQLRKPCGTMTPYLIAAREGIIWWVMLTLVLVEIVFNAIEGDLDRRGVSP
jgi:hypothetical protein